MVKSFSRIIISRLAGFIFFLILLAIANVLIPHISNNVYSEVVGFFNSSLVLLLILCFVGIVNEIFWNSYFPVSLLGPISGAVLGVFVVRFIYNFWNFLDSSYVHSTVVIPIRAIYLLVILLSLIIGYLIVLSRGGRPRTDWDEEGDEWKKRKLEWKKEKINRRMERIENRLDKKEVEWEEVGDEFRLAFYNLGKIINNALEGESRNPKKKKKRK